MQTFKYVPCGTYYVPFNSQLIQFYIESVTFVDEAPSRSRVIYKGLHQGSSLTFYADTKFYNSEEDYFKDNPIPYSTLTPDFICRKFGCLKHGDDFTGWIFTNELAEQVFFRSSEIRQESRTWIFTPVKDGQVFYEEVYCSRQELLDNNIIHVINDDGTETKITGINLRLKFSDEQEQLICRFEELTSQMYDAGIAISYDDNSSCLYAFNLNNFPDAEQLYSESYGKFRKEVGSRELKRLCTVDFATWGDRRIGVDKISD